MSSDFGQLQGMRHLTVGDDCAIAGAATAVHREAHGLVADHVFEVKEGS